jgi:hypothetical protein
MYYVSMLWYCQLVRILVRTNHPCLKVGCHIWYLSLMSIIPRWRPYFQKPMVRIQLDAHIRTIVVLTGGKLTEIYFLHLLSVTMHRWQCTKVSILPPGDVNPRPVPSRRGSGMHGYLLCTILVVVVPACDPKDLFMEHVTMFTTLSIGLIWVGLVE